MPTLHQSALDWFRDLAVREGFFRAIAIAADDFLGLVLDYLPSRRRLRFGDIDYDWDHHVDTTWANPTLRVRLQEIFTRGKYQPSEPDLFHRILCQLPIRFEDFVFIDLGSGKGRTLLMASDYPFREITGVEIIPELSEVAVDNIARYHSPQQRCFAISSHTGDARQFHFPDHPSVLYLFNPFPEDVLREVLANLESSLHSNPRPAWVIYHNLVHENVFAESRFLQRVSGTHQFAMYKAERSAVSPQPSGKPNPASLSR